MEKNQKLLLGGLALAAVLVVTGLLGGFQKLMGGSENDRIRQAASLANPSANPTPTANPTPANHVQPNATDPEPQPTGPTTSIKYEEEAFDFGLVNEGDHVIHTFKFKNTGSEPLIISNARGSCGCTVPTWPKDAVAPGESAEIRVDFNTQGKPGNQSKRVTVVANTNPSETFLTIQGIVRGKDQPATAKGN